MVTKITTNKEESKKRILLIDNDHDITTVFKIGLEDDGFEVDAYNNPEQALSNFKSDYYGLLLLDIGMPNINGFDLHDKIKKIDNKPKVCFFTASELYYKNLLEEYQISHQSCFIAKPTAIEELIERVRKELSLHSTLL